MRALARPGAAIQFGPFLEYARRRLRDVDTRMLRSLIPGTGYVPDVLTPTPRFAPSFRVQLEEVRATPAEAFADQVAWMECDPGTTREWKARTATTRAFAVQHPERVLPVVADQLEHYWRAVLEPIWERLNRSLDHDIRDRTFLAEHSGTAAMLSSVDERVSWDGSTLSVRSRYQLSTTLGAAGIAFVPSVFSQSEVLTALSLEPMLVYPRTLASDFWSERPESADPLEPWLRSDAVLVSTASVQSPLFESSAGRRRRPRLVGCNPMFRPTLSTVGRRVLVVTADDADETAAVPLTAALQGRGAVVERLGPADHEAVMTVTQVLPHAALLAVASVLASSSIDPALVWRLAPPPARTVLAGAARILDANPHVYAEIQQADGAEDIRARLAEAVLALGTDTADDLAERLAKVRDGLSEIIGPAATVAADLSALHGSVRGTNGVA